MSELKLQIKSLSAGVMFLIFAMIMVTLGVLSWTDAKADITVTPHNLSSAGVGQTSEICVFCHTPHGGDTNASVPLWNKTLAAPSSYTTYDSLGTSSNDGDIAPVGSVSIACLSCHDGTQAIDSLINEPGSGFDSAGFIADPGFMTGDPVLGTDLQDDHPIGVQYAGGGISEGGAVGTSQGTKVDEDFIDPVVADVNGTTIWWVNTTEGGTTGREKEDMQLYTRNDGPSGLVEPFVECASCHDPHSEVNATFLRVSNDGSAVCLSCHIK